MGLQPTNLSLLITCKGQLVLSSLRNFHEIKYRYGKKKN